MPSATVNNALLCSHKVLSPLADISFSPIKLYLINNLSSDEYVIALSFFFLTVVYMNTNLSL